MWPDSVGKGTADYVEEAVSPVERAPFEQKFRDYIVLHGLGSVSCRKVVVQVLFEISDNYCKRFTAIALMKKDNLIRDFKRRQKLMKSTDRQFDNARGSLKGDLANSQLPNTALLARRIDAKLAKLQKRLRDEFVLIKHHQGASEIMLRALSLKYVRTNYVAELDHYVDKYAFPRLKQKEKAVIIAGTMLAARAFTVPEAKTYILNRIPMMRSRAQQFIRQEFMDDDDDGPVFQTEPRR